LTFDLLYGKDGHNYHVVKIDMATGQAYDFTEEDARVLLEEEAKKEWAVRNHRLVSDTAQRLQEGYGP